MPIYEYRCETCHQVFEEWSRQVEDADAVRPCPHCEAPAPRILSHTSFALKGEGWYVTEYGSHKGKSDAPAESAKESPCKEGCASSGGKEAKGCASGACPSGGCASRTAAAS